MPENVSKSREHDDLAMTLACFDATRCDFIGQVLHPIEPDQRLEQQHFPGWYNWLYPAPQRAGKRLGSGLQIIHDQGTPVLEWPEILPCLLIVNDRSWQNYQVDAELRCVMTHARFYDHDEMTFEGRSFAGVAFRIQDSRRHYIAGFSRAREAFIGLREDGQVAILAQMPFEVDVRRYYRISARCEENQLSLSIDGKQVLTAIDDRWRSGGAGIYSNTVARFRRAAIRCCAAEGAAIESRKLAQAAALKTATGATPQARRLASIQLPADRCVINDVLRLEENLLLISEQGMALCALDMRGRIRWRFAAPDGATELEAVVGDVDLDGAPEVLALSGSSIILLDGHTGKLRCQAPYPAGSPFIHLRGESAKLNHHPFIVWSAGRNKPARFCFFEDTGAGAHTLWNYDHNLQLRWTHHQHVGKSGHRLHSYDIDGDGRDEIVMAYYALDDDGRRLWQVPDIDLIYKQDHADNWYVGPTGEGERGKLRIIAACGERGIMVADATNGRIIKLQSGLGHMQRCAAGHFIPGRTDRQVWLWTDWGSPGIFYLVDGDGAIISRMQPDPRCTAAMPIRWCEDGHDLLLLPTTLHGLGAGMYDHEGRRVVDLGLPALEAGQFSVFDLLPGPAQQVLVVQGRTLSVFGRNS